MKQSLFTQVKLMFNVVDQNWIRSNLYQLETFDREDKHYHWKEEYEQRRRSKWDFKATQSMATAYLSLSLSMNTDQRWWTKSIIFAARAFAGHKEQMCCVSQSTSDYFLRDKYCSSPSASPEENKRGRTAVSRLHLWRTAPCGVFQSYIHILLCSTNYW